MVNIDKNIVIEGAGLSQLDETADQMLRASEGSKIWLLHGDMGSGKTTLIKSICSKLGVTDNVSSPTFSIINEYSSRLNSVYHFDFYRIKTLDEALETGVEDYLFSGNYCFIEWPDLIIPILPDNYLVIRIEEGVGENRIYKLSCYDSN